MAISNCQMPISNWQSEIDNGKCLSGGVAQLAEHMVCNHGVRGSNPLTSTRTLSIDDLRLPIVTAALFAVSTIRRSKLSAQFRVER